MNIKEAIERYTSNAEFERTHGNLQGCLEFKQLAEWLKDYKRLLEQQPCEDAISRQDVLNLFNKSDNYSWEMSWLKRKIEKIPSFKLQEKTGHWIKLFLTDTSDVDGQCSECGFIHKFIDGHTAQYDHCPNCGARMESEVE